MKFRYALLFNCAEKTLKKGIYMLLIGKIFFTFKIYGMGR